MGGSVDGAVGSIISPSWLHIYMMNVSCIVCMLLSSILQCGVILDEVMLDFVYHCDGFHFYDTSYVENVVFF